jgi:hypothetical protein
MAKDKDEEAEELREEAEELREEALAEWVSRGRPAQDFTMAKMISALRMLAFGSVPHV